MQRYFQKDWNGKGRNNKAKGFAWEAYRGWILTEKGEALQPVLDQMAAFSTQYYAKEVFKDGKVRKLEDVYGYALS
jgi:hypothetical protein